MIHMGQKKNISLEGFEPTKTSFFILCGTVSILGQSAQWEIMVFFFSGIKIYTEELIF